jgi:hypothetical protein
VREFHLDLWVGEGFVIKRGKGHRVHFGILRNFLASKYVIFRHLVHFIWEKISVNYNMNFKFYIYPVWFSHGIIRILIIPWILSYVLWKIKHDKKQHVFDLFHFLYIFLGKIKNCFSVFLKPIKSPNEIIKSIWERRRNEMKEGNYEIKAKNVIVLH